jgi:demethylmenaquinone methyltransferase/2-methoxy-6-polyprenyl-1,4-benzoquinol methylase
MLFDIYFTRVLPVIGRIVSGHPSAYAYLPASVLEFPCGEAFAEFMRGAGFSGVKVFSLTLGIAALYRGKKP